MDTPQQLFAPVNVSKFFFYYFHTRKYWHDNGNFGAHICQVSFCVMLVYVNCFDQCSAYGRHTCPDILTLSDTVNLSHLVPYTLLI